jgi:hypothetical protein
MNLKVPVCENNLVGEHLTPDRGIKWELEYGKFRVS